MNEIENVQQMKLTNGEEVVCEVLEWDEDILTVRNALQITRAFNEDESVYVFKQWMTYCTDLLEPVTVNPNNLIALYKPHRVMHVQYLEALDTLGEHAKDIATSYEQFEKDRDEDANKPLDSSTNIVNLFGGKDTVH